MPKPFRMFYHAAIGWRGIQMLVGITPLWWGIGICLKQDGPVTRPQYHLGMQLGPLSIALDWSPHAEVSRCIPNFEPEQIRRDGKWLPAKKE